MTNFIRRFCTGGGKRMPSKFSATPNPAQVPQAPASETEKEITSKRRLHQMTLAISKDLIKSEKTLIYMLEQGRLEKQIDAIKAKGFTIENHVESNTLFLKKVLPNGDNILIDFWKEVRDFIVAVTSYHITSHHITPVTQTPFVCYVYNKNSRSIVIEHSKQQASPINLYYKCITKGDLLGLQTLELAPPELISSGVRNGIFGFPSQRDISQKMKASFPLSPLETF